MMPASYVVIEGGQVHMYFSRTDGQFMPRILLAGPEATLAYVHTLDPSDGLVTADWARGGAVIDADRRALRFFGGEDIMYEAYLRRPVLRAMRRRWPGWDVGWAHNGIVDLAKSAGHDIEASLGKPHFDFPRLAEGPGPIIPERDAQAVDSPQEAQSVLSVRWPGGGVCDYLLVPFLDRVLSLGPRLLEVLADQPPAPLPREDDQLIRDRTYGFVAFVDAPGRVLWLGIPTVISLRDLASVARRWPDWEVRGHTEGLARQVELSGRDPAMVMAPEEVAIAEALKGLSFDPFLYEHVDEEQRAEISRLLQPGTEDTDSTQS